MIQSPQTYEVAIILGIWCWACWAMSLHLPELPSILLYSASPAYNKPPNEIGIAVSEPGERGSPMGNI